MKKITLSAKFLLTVVLLTLIVASAVTSTRAQDTGQQYQYLPVISKIDLPRWIGPEGGTVTFLMTDPTNSSVLYAGAKGTGVYKSTNGGASWSPANKNISTLTVESLAIDRSSASILFAGTEGQGVYKSTDGGATWNAANQGIKANSIVLSLVINPGNPDLVYAATLTQGTTNGVLYKTWDRGANWTAVLTQTGNWVNSLSVNPDKPNYILAATQNNGPYYATSYGSSGDWHKATISGGDWPTGMWVSYDTKIEAGMAFYVTQANDLYRSTDNGVNWTHEYDGPSTTVVSRNGLAINPFIATRLYKAASSSDVSGVQRSDDKGDSWQAAGLKGKKVNTVVVSNANMNTVLAGVDQEGVYISTDGGTNWNSSATGLGSSNVTGLVFSGTSTFYAGTFGGGVFKTTNAGTSWSGFNNNLTDVLINGLVQHPTQPNIIFALTATSGLHRYDLNGGTGWLSAEGLPEYFDKANIALRADPATAAATTAVGINAMAFAPSNADIAYLATNGGGVYASSNSGQNFSPKGLANEVVKSITVKATDPNTVYVATSLNGVVKKSTDGGIAWITLALPDAQLQQAVNAVAMWPGEADSVCAGTSNGVWKFNGTSWDSAGLQGYTVNVLVPDPVHSGVMIAGTNRGTFFSGDHQNWFAIDSSMGTLDVASISFNPAEPGMLYIGTVDRGTLRIFLY